MPDTPEVFLRDTERLQDENVDVLVKALLAYLAAHDGQDEEDDSNALILFIRRPVIEFALAYATLLQRYAPMPEEFDAVDRDLLLSEALAAASAAFWEAARLDPQVLAGHGDPARVQRLRHVVETMLTSVTSQIGDMSAEMVGFTHKVWRTRLDSRVRTAHRLLEGRSVPLGGSFVTVGGRLRFPGDRTAPPALWINCRCVLAYRTLALAIPEAA